MSKRQFKAQASSSRIGGSAGFGGGFGSATGAFGGASSPLSYLAEQPDLSTISDANVVVSFKNLSKRDSTTKAKALDELQAYVSTESEQQHELEEGFLDAWVGKSCSTTTYDIHLEQIALVIERGIVPQTLWWIEGALRLVAVLHVPQLTWPIVMTD